MPRSLVTGGAGFIGSNLALELEKLGHEVVVVDDFTSASEHNLKTFKGTFLRTDVSELKTLPGSFDTIFHQAAITDPRYGNDEEVFNKNLSGFRRLLDLSLQTKCRLVYASTAGLYGNGPTPMQEDQAKDCLTAYGKSKLEMDRVAEEYFDRLPIVGLRYFNVFGPRETHKGRPASMILHLLRQMNAGKPPKIFKFGEHQRDFIYVDDVVRANLLARHSPSGIFNVGTGVATSFNELIHVLNQTLGTQFAPEYIEMPFEGKTYQNHTVAETSRAEIKLGFKAKWTLSESVMDYKNWLTNENLLAV